MNVDIDDAVVLADEAVLMVVMAAAACVVGVE